MSTKHTPHMIPPEQTSLINAANQAVKQLRESATYMHEARASLENLGGEFYRADLAVLQDLLRLHSERAEKAAQALEEEIK